MEYMQSACLDDGDYDDYLLQGRSLENVRTDKDDVFTPKNSAVSIRLALPSVPLL